VTSAPLSWNLRDFAPAPIKTKGPFGSEAVTPSARPAHGEKNPPQCAPTFQSVIPLRSFCLRVSGRVAPSASTSQAAGDLSRRVRVFGSPNAPHGGFERYESIECHAHESNSGGGNALIEQERSCGYDGAMDKLSPDARSKLMAKVRSRDTRPEIALRSALHRAGFRFRKNVATLPGKPDIVLPRYKIAVFVHGCFWHAHKNCKRASIPKTNTAFWRDKISRNAKRDMANQRKLRNLGWRVCIVWECRLKNVQKVVDRIARMSIDTKQEH